MSEVFSRRVSSSSHLILIRFIFHPCIYVAAGEKQSLAMDNCRCGMPFKDLFYPMAPFFNSKFVWEFEGLLSKQSFFLNNGDAEALVEELTFTWHGPSLIPGLPMANVWGSHS
jgi:hypothetical protein